MHKPTVRLFSEVRHYHDIGAASTAAILNHRNLSGGGWLAREMIRVAFKRRRPWHERVATRYVGFVRFVQPQHSPEAWERIVRAHHSALSNGRI